MLAAVFTHNRDTWRII